MGLKRSRDLPIDFKFALIDAVHALAFEPLVLRLAAHAHRWRSVSVTFSGALTFQTFLSLVTKPTPQLRALKLDLWQRNFPIWSVDNVWPVAGLNSAEARILPHAPRIESLTLSNVKIVPKCHQLVQFDADGIKLGDETWQVISNNRESLQALTLTGERQIDDSPRPVQLPHLTELVIGGEIGAHIEDGRLRADFIVMPQLESLIVYGGKRGQTGLHHLISVNRFEHLRKLRLCGLHSLHQSSACVLALATLSNLRHLELSDCTMPDELLARMCVSAPADCVIWPRLEVLIIGSKIEKMLSRRILKMARLRGPHQPRDDADRKLRPWAVLEVNVLSVQEFPKWWDDEIAALAKDAARLRH